MIVSKEEIKKIIEKQEKEKEDYFSVPIYENFFNEKEKTSPEKYLEENWETERVYRSKCDHSWAREFELLKIKNSPYYLLKCTYEDEACCDLPSLFGFNEYRTEYYYDIKLCTLSSGIYENGDREAFEYGEYIPEEIFSNIKFEPKYQECQKIVDFFKHEVDLLKKEIQQKREQEGKGFFDTIPKRVDPKWLDEKKERFEEKYFAQAKELEKTIFKTIEKPKPKVKHSIEMER